jgi:hypothetical protein
VQQKAVFFASLLFAKVLKTDNMNIEDLLQQNTTHTFSKRTEVFSLSLPRVRSTLNMVREREAMAPCGGT